MEDDYDPDLHQGRSREQRERGHKAGMFAFYLLLAALLVVGFAFLLGLIPDLADAFRLIRR